MLSPEPWPAARTEAGGVLEGWTSFGSFSFKQLQWNIIQRLNLLNENSPYPVLPIFSSSIPVFFAGDHEFPAEREQLQEAATGGSAPAELRRSELGRCPGAPAPAQPRCRAREAAQFDRSLPGDHPLRGPTGMSLQQRHLWKKPGLGEIQVVNDFRRKKCLPLEFHFFPHSRMRTAVFLNVKFSLDFCKLLIDLLVKS